MDADTLAGVRRGRRRFDKTVGEAAAQVHPRAGNSTDRAEAYRQFRGRDPDVKALLEKRGFESGTATR